MAKRGKLKVDKSEFTLPVAFDGVKTHKFLLRLARPRLAGTPGERQAAELIRKVWQSAGLKARIEKFPVVTYRRSKAELTVLKPYRARCEAAVVGRTGSTPPGGIEAELVYLEAISPVTLARCKGKIILVGGRLGWEQYEQARKAGVRGFVAIGKSGVPVDQKAVNAKLHRKFGHLPGVCVSHEDAFRMIRDKAARVRLVCVQQHPRSESGNVVATIPGVLAPQEQIIVGGHFDGVDTSPAACDNGAGTAIIVELARIFAKASLARTVTFVCFGAEEIGLEGSQAYVKRHKRDMEKVRLMLNVDIAGVVVGRNNAFCCGPEALYHYIECLGHETGMAFSMSKDVYSSDNVPFGDAGVPSAAITRGGGDLRFCHTALDEHKYISPDALAGTGRFVADLITRCANAEVFPIEREIPSEVKEKIDKYVERMRGPQAKRGKK